LVDPQQEILFCDLRLEFDPKTGMHPRIQQAFAELFCGLPLPSSIMSAASFVEASIVIESSRGYDGLRQ
jgi:hypothetical protein